MTPTEWKVDCWVSPAGLGDGYTAIKTRLVFIKFNHMKIKVTSAKKKKRPGLARGTAP